MAPVTIYTRDFCGYCARAKALLDSKGVDYAEYNATTTPEYRQEMIEKSGGANLHQWRTCRRLRRSACTGACR